MSAKIIYFDFRLPENLYMLNKSGESIAVLCAITGYSASFVSKMIQRELCRESKKLAEQKLRRPTNEPHGA